MTEGQATTPTASLTKQEIIDRMADLQSQLSNLQVQLEMVQEENDKPEPSEETRAKAKEMNPIADLMEIFTVSEKYDYKRFPRTSERKNQFKNTEEGVRAMSDSLEAWAEERAKAQAQAMKQETMATSIVNVMSSFNVSLDRAMDALNIPESERETYTAMMQTRV